MLKQGIAERWFSAERRNFGCGRRDIKQTADDTLLGVGQGEKDFSRQDAITGLAQLELERIASTKKLLLCRKLRISFPAFQHSGCGRRRHFLRDRPGMS